MELQTTCTHCQGNISSSDFFCPNCGTKLKEKPPSTSLITQVLIYSLSLFLPPLGIWPAIKYLRRPDQKSKNVGLVALILTIVSTVLTIYLSVVLFDTYTKDLSNQIKVYQDLDL